MVQSLERYVHAFNLPCEDGWMWLRSQNPLSDFCNAHQGQGKGILRRREGLIFYFFKRTREIFMKFDKNLKLNKPSWRAKGSTIAHRKTVSGSNLHERPCLLSSSSLDKTPSCHISHRFLLALALPPFQVSLILFLPWRIVRFFSLHEKKHCTKHVCARFVSPEFTTHNCALSALH